LAGNQLTNDFGWNFRVVNVSPGSTYWDGGGDGVSWHDPRNWVNDILPTATNDILILTVGVPFTVRHTTGSTTIKALHCQADFILNGSSLVVTGQAEFQSSFTMDSASTLTASGAAASMAVTGPTVSGGSLYASGGAVLSLPGVRRYQDGNTCCRTWQASGAGSVLSLPGLTNLVGNTFSSIWAQNIQALAGGRIELGALGVISGGAVSVLADGTNSVVDLSTLNSFNPAQATFVATNGGVILRP
jgi:hypothetical protein